MAQLPIDPAIHITYQLQRRKCGKSSCKKCKEDGIGHGPYWYGYWYEGTRLRSGYVGKNAPVHLPPPGQAQEKMEQGQDAECILAEAGVA